MKGKLEPTTHPFHNDEGGAGRSFNGEVYDSQKTSYKAKARNEVRRARAT